MTLQQLRYFLAAAEHGSFSAAAAELLMAQPSLSDQIRKLEAELGVPLFARVGRGLALTEVADAIREGALEAGLIALPIDDRGLEVRPSIREEIHYVSADPERVRRPRTIADLAAAPLILYDARWGPVD